MRVIIQRVKSASVTIDHAVISKINQGLLVLLGISHQDSPKDIRYLVKKIMGLRIFSDDAGKMNLCISDIEGEILVVSQFTLYADTRKGNRPGFTDAAPPSIAIPLYEEFVHQISQELGKPIATGVFGADMQVSLVNDGPVTIAIDSLQAPNP